MVFTDRGIFTSQKGELSELQIVKDYDEFNLNL